MELTTERLLLRTLVWEDIDRYRCIMNDSAVANNISAPYFPDDAERARALFQDYLDRYKDGRELRLAIVLSGSNKLIGMILLKRNIDKNCANLGYWLDKRYWGKGYITEAACAMVNVGFNTLKLDCIYANCFFNNYRSIRVLQKLGMVYEKDIDIYVKKWQRMEKQKRYVIRASQYDF